jgi:GMP synthase (glutamine-hydrolysing)
MFKRDPMITRRSVTASGVSRGVILAILHQEHSTCGRVGYILRQHGFTIEVRRPALGCALPNSLEGYAGVMVFGGPMSANDEHEWLRCEIDWLATVLRVNLPYLGLCLGAQLMARQLGARVYSHPERIGEQGYHSLRPTAAGAGLCAAEFPQHVYHWHFEGFDLPRQAISLAEGAGEFPNQAYLLGRNVVGLQFHPEVTYQMMCRWTTRGAKGDPELRRRHLSDWFEYDRAVAKWIEAFLHAWARDALAIPECQHFAVAAE